MKVPLQNIKGEIVDYAIVDEDDFVKVAEHSWCKTLEGYANGTINSDPITLKQVNNGTPKKIYKDKKPTI